MNPRCELELDSYRLAAYAEQIFCYICDGANTFESEYCRHCCAPMALSHQAKTHKLCPQLVAVLGSSGVGKTVYLGMLMDTLSRRENSMQVCARGAFSVTLQQNTTAELERCEFPPKTPNEPDQWNWVHCRVQSKRPYRDMELILPDIAGESILEEIEHPQSFPAIRSLLEKCSGVILLLDSVQLGDGRHRQEHFAMKVFSFLSEIDSHPKTGWPSRPVSVVFSKADQIDECMDDPTAFAQEHVPGVWSDCQKRFNKARFFASGVAGSCAFRTEIDQTRRRIPLRIEPRGIRDPFVWIVDSLPRIKQK